MAEEALVLTGETTASSEELRKVRCFLVAWYDEER